MAAFVELEKGELVIDTDKIESIDKTSQMKTKITMVSGATHMIAMPFSALVSLIPRKTSFEEIMSNMDKHNTKPRGG